MKMIFTIIIVMIVILVFTSIVIAKTDSEKLEEILSITSRPSLSLFGTDYSPTDDGTIFLQLLDDNKQAINNDNASCYINTWYPNKTSFISDTLMNYLDDGLFYYDVTIPSALGVYMVSGSCSLPPDAWSDNFIDFSYVELYENVSIILDKVILPSGEQVELPSDINMTGNILLTHMNEGSGKIIDVSPSSNNGTYNGALYNQTGKLFGALGFDGVNDFVDLDTPASMFGLAEGTVAVWFKIDDLTHMNYIIQINDIDGISGSSPPRNDWRMTYVYSTYVPDRYKLQITSTTDDQYYQVYSSAQVIQDNDWHHWVVVQEQDEDTLFYLDGTEISTYAGADGYPQNLTLDQNNLDNAHLGRFKDGSVEVGYFEGDMDEFVIWDRALSETEVSAVYLKGFGGATHRDGYVRSISKTLQLNNIWNTFGSDYDIKDGTINWSILNSSNDIICNDLGDISTCAGNITPIKLYAELSRENGTTNSSPEIDSWYVSWDLTEVQEIKGAGELNVKNWATGGDVNVTINTTEIAEEVWNYDGIIVNNILSQFAIAVWNFTGTIAIEILDQFSINIWNQESRNLTFHPDVNTSIINTTLIAEDVWNSSIRDLTYYETINVSLSDNATQEISDQITCNINQLFKTDNGQWMLDMSDC